MEKPKSVNYVPFYYSNLYKSVPDGEDVIYSSRDRYEWYYRKKIE